VSAPGLACAGLAACGAAQSALDPAGDGATLVASLWWPFFWTCTGVFIAVMIALAWGCLRRRSPAWVGAVTPTVHPPPEGERRIGFVVGGGAAVTAAILIVFALATFLVDRRLFAHTGDGEISVQVTGHQWWWEVHYQDPVPSNSFATANELHIPVGATVKVTLDSPDVIHSFWVPNLQGKMDLIPGQKNTIWLTARDAGTYRGQCAEFCGLQHASMALMVVAEPRDRFDAWAEKQRQSAPEPQSDDQKRGKEIFLSGPCVMCHAIQGTTAGAVLGPDLTHVAGRLTLAAGRLPNTRGHLAGWIVDPQSQKPGAQMPPNLFRGEELQALLSYLGMLQ
jgi:cytochrome c oxidase subunit 2